VMLCFSCCAALRHSSSFPTRRSSDLFSRDQLVEDPDDWVGTHLLQFAQTFSVEQHHFYAFYLLSHGVVKSILVVGLLREKLWARSEEHTSELQSQSNLVCRLLLEKKK